DLINLSSTHDMLIDLHIAIALHDALPIYDYLLFLGRIHPDKGTAEAITIAQKSMNRLVIAGIIQDQNYFDEKVSPHLNEKIQFRSEEHTSELQSRENLVCRLLLEKKTSFR